MCVYAAESPLPPAQTSLHTAFPYHSQRHFHITPHDKSTSPRTNIPISLCTAAPAPTPTHPQIVEARAGYTHLRGVCAAPPWNPAPRGIPARPRPTITARRQHAAGTDYARPLRSAAALAPLSSTRYEPRHGPWTQCYAPGRGTCSVCQVDVALFAILFAPLHRCTLASSCILAVSLFACVWFPTFPLPLPPLALPQAISY